MSGGDFSGIMMGQNVNPVQNGIELLYHGYSGILGKSCGLQPVANGPKFCGSLSKEVMSGSYLSASRLNWVHGWHPALEQTSNPSLELARTLGLIRDSINHDWKSVPSKPSVGWLSHQFEQSNLWGGTGVNRLSIDQPAVDWWLTSLLIYGQPDPTSADVLAFFLKSEKSLEDLNVWPFKDEFWWFRSDIFYPGLANLTNG